MSMKLKKMIREGATTDTSQSTRIKALEDAIGSETKTGTILKRIKDLEDAAATEETPSGES